MDFTRIFDLLAYQENKFPQERAINSFGNGQWAHSSTYSIQSGMNIISCWFLKNGSKKGDCIAVVPKMGSTEWVMVDMASQQCGMITVPIHPTSSAEEMSFILQETRASICITADKALSEKVQALQHELPLLKSIFHLEKNQTGYFPAFQHESGQDQTDELNQRKSEVLETDLLAILYTSGTSGISKGAVLTHANVVSNIKSVIPLYPLRPGDRVFSFLPYSHIFERTTSYAYIALGVNIYFCDQVENLTLHFKSVRPYFCTTVPRTLEKMYNFLLEEKEKKNRLKRAAISWAMRIGEVYKNDQKNILFFGIQLQLVRWLVLYRWRNSLGGKLRYMGVGAAALRPEIARLFSASKIQMLCGYGMTEASPFISVNRYQPGLNRFGTVGIPVPGVEIMLDDPNENGEGEILVKGPNIMKGYFNRPELTTDAFTSEGWLRTGDVGKWVDGRFLSITDRKKDIFKTSAGKYISPQPLENHFCSSSFIIQCLIIGFNRPYVTALIVPNFALLKTWCDENSIHWTSPTFMVHNIKVIKKIEEEVHRLNESLQGFEKVRDFVLSDEEWTVENKDLTTSFKPKRNLLLQKHQADIEKMYKSL